MPAAHSRHALLENGKSFVHFLHTGLLHSEHSIEAVLVLQRKQSIIILWCHRCPKRFLGT